MVVTKLLLLAGLLGLAYGQTIYYDLGTELRVNAAQLLSTASSDRQICFNGANTFYTNGAEIRQVAGNSLVLTATDVVESLACACDTLAFTYQSGGNTFLEYRDIANTDVFIRVILTDASGNSAGRTAVRVDRETNNVIAVSATTFWIYSLDFLVGTVVTGSAAIGDVPHCIAAHFEVGTSTWYIFSSFDWIPTVILTTYDGTTVTVAQRSVQRPNSFTGRVACVDIDASLIYFLQESSGGPTWEITSYSVNNWFTTSPAYATSATRLQSGTVDALANNVNGLVVCGTSCAATCVATCDCTDTCGFCVDNEVACQCQNSASDNCVYGTTALAATCLVLQAPIDAFCVISNPLLKRRKGDPAHVVGVSRQDASVTVNRRTVKTGRWNVNALPIRTTFGPVSGPTTWHNGFTADVPASARGRRFGVYLMDINPTAADLATQRLNCIVTENSGFFNDFYTYTGVVGAPITMVASAAPGSQVSTRLSQLRWYFTSVDLPNVGVSADATPVSPSCGAGTGDGTLTCTLSNLAATDEGVYEVYRAGRRARTWHPIFYLYVRACGVDNWGVGCATTCATSGCVHGHCDESGNCVCYPGWMGANCDTVCTVGMVGQSCDIPCNNIFPGNTDCSNLLFCQPAKLGCTCSTGLEAPECLTACAAGSFGPNCRQTCTPPCGARDGV